MINFKYIFKTTSCRILLLFLFILTFSAVSLYQSDSDTKTTITQRNFVDDFKKNYLARNPQASGFWAVVGNTRIYDFMTANDTYEWITGQGTISHPFRIENVTFDGDGIEYALRIGDLQGYYFEIVNCTFKNAHSNYPGLYLGSCHRGHIENCSFTANKYGMSLSNCQNISITSCQSFLNTDSGIFIKSCENVSITDSNLFYNYLNGLKIEESTACYINHNNVSNQYYNILLDDTDHIYIRWNNLTNQSSGVKFHNSNEYIDVSSNWIENCTGFYPYGIYGTDFIYSNFTHNWIFNTTNGFLLGRVDFCLFQENYIENCIDYGIEISGVNNSFIDNCITQVQTGIRSSSLHNSTIEGGSITNATFGGIDFNTACSNLSISNLMIENCTSGILGGVTSGFLSVSNCNISNIKDHAIALNNNNYGIVDGNLIRDANIGIYSMNDAKILNNYVTNCNTHLYFSGGTNVHVLNNTLASHTTAGLPTLLSMGFVENGIIENNTFLRSKGYCIYLCYTTNISVVGNVFWNHLAQVVYLLETDHTIFYRNSFLWGLTDLIVGIGETNTFFNNSEMGNYWKNFDGEDIDMDSIGENSYIVDAPLSLIDYKPIVTKSYSIFNPIPSDRTIEVNNSSGVIQWDVIINPLIPGKCPNYNPEVQSYTVFRNGEAIDTGEWQYCIQILTNYDLLPEGEYVYSLNLTDEWGNEISQKMQISVVNTPPLINIVSSSSKFLFTYQNESEYIQFLVEDPSVSTFLYNLTIDGLIKEINQILPGTNQTSYFLDELDVGSHNITFEVSDGYGEYTNFNTNFTILNDSPTIHLFSSLISNSTEIGDTTSNITFSVEDPNYTDMFANITLNGIMYKLNENISSTLQYTMLPVNLSEGEYHLIMTVMDGYGSKISLSYNFTIYNTPPMINPVCSYENYVLEIGTINENITFFVSDPSYRDFLSNLTINDDFLEVDCNLTSTKSYIVNVSSFGVGNYSICFYVSDGYGQAAMMTKNVSIINTPPILSIQSSFSNNFTAGTTGNNITFHILDPSLGKASYNLTINGTIVANNFSLPGNHSIFIGFDDLIPGQYSLNMSVMDGYGEATHMNLIFWVLEESQTSTDDTTDDDSADDDTSDDDTSDDDTSDDDTSDDDTSDDDPSENDKMTTVEIALISGGGGVVLIGASIGIILIKKKGKKPK